MQDLAVKEADAIYKLIVEEEGHIYVCGDVTMAEHVYLTIRYVILFIFSLFFFHLNEFDRFHVAVCAFAPCHIFNHSILFYCIIYCIIQFLSKQYIFAAAYKTLQFIQ